ncbi:MAG: dependent epimerase/dehydratase family protein [Planctomycetaceae bacterium]|nr:dependent epimerase/dehydratase family protein [Planctomycetaceae bacterium]
MAKVELLKPLENETDLDEALSRPTEGVLETLRAVPGDVLVLGAGGKMGPTLARMLRRACEQLSDLRSVYGVSRFSSADVASQLRYCGVIPIACDLTDRAAVNRLPDAPNIIFMTGQKFGTADRPELTWVMNTHVPAIVAERFPASRIVAFSTGCVYPFVPVTGRGSSESDALDPAGEYANSCVGRERIFTHFSQQNGTPLLLFRLNYAIDLRYGVLLDVAQKVYRGLPVDVSMGYVNVIWQRDANARAIQCLDFTSSPAAILNVTGRQRVSIRELAQQFGRLFGREPQITQHEAPTALLSDATRSFDLFGPVTVSLDEMVTATANWVSLGGRSLGKPTHFETRDGQY